jgi:hypothetical protein
MKMLNRASHVNVLIFVLFGLARGAYLIDFNNVFHRNLANVKREGKSDVSNNRPTPTHSNSFT